MNKKFLNLLIAISTIGIVFLFARDTFFAPIRSRKLVANITPSKTPTISNIKNIDSPTACQHKYFNFAKGTAWRYKLNSNIDIKGDTKNSSKNSEYYFTNRLVQASPSSAVMETIFDNDDEKIQTILTCRKSGIYGFPFPFTGPDLQKQTLDKSKALFAFGKIDKNMLFLPAGSKLKVGESWQSKISVNTPIPFLSSINITIGNKIAGQRMKTTKEKTTIKILDIESKIEKFDFALDSIKLPKDNIFTYSLEENTGVSNFVVDFKLPEFGSFASSLELIDFKPSPQSSSE